MAHEAAPMPGASPRRPRVVGPPPRREAVDLEAKPAPPRVPSRLPFAADDLPASLTIDCDRCAVRGHGCGDCMVTVLLGGPPDGVVLDDDERRAIAVLVEAGLAPPLRMVTPLDVAYHTPAEMTPSVGRAIEAGGTQIH